MITGELEGPEYAAYRALTDHASGVDVEQVNGFRYPERHGVTSSQSRKSYGRAENSTEPAIHLRWAGEAGLIYQAGRFRSLGFSSCWRGICVCLLYYNVSGILAQALIRRIPIPTTGNMKKVRSR